MLCIHHALLNGILKGGRISVTSLLQLLGLGKCNILFQAKEVSNLHLFNLLKEKFPEDKFFCGECLTFPYFEWKL